MSAMTRAQIRSRTRLIPSLGVAATVLALALPLPAFAQASPFGEGWSLDRDASSLSFVSVKNESKVETSGFAQFSGEIDPTGRATITIPLDSVDTGIDLRNVRMRFLFFETFLHPEATVTAQVDPAAIADLAEKRRKRLSMDFTLDLHGVQQQMQAEVIATLITDTQVSVASAAPITIPIAPFGLEEGLLKLEEAASVDIVPSATVSFDFVFRSGPPPSGSVTLAGTTGGTEPAGTSTTGTGTTGTTGTVTTVATTTSTAPTVDEPEVFDETACAGRFEILSRTGAIYFGTGSAELDSESTPLLDTAFEVMQRCPQYNLVIEGHTDSSGAAALNQRLSEARARSVVAYLVGKGIAAGRLSPVGYGEDRPVQPNDTAWNRSRNRRIEFVIAGQ